MLLARFNLWQRRRRRSASARLALPTGPAPAVDALAVGALTIPEPPMSPCTSDGTGTKADPGNAASGLRSTKASASQHPRSARRRPHRAAFTLMETGLAIVIVGTGVVSIMYAQQAFHQKNAWSSHASTATFLANEIREMTMRLPRHDPVTGRTFWGPEGSEYYLYDYDDLDDFDGFDGSGTEFSARMFNGPVNAMREVIPNMEGWIQHVRIFNVQPYDTSAAGNPDLDGLTDVMRIEVIVSYQADPEGTPEEVTRIAWIAPR